MIGRAKDVYTWHAIYDDDDFISEYDRPEGRGFAEVEQSHTKALLLTPLQGGACYRVDIPQGAQPVFFRRRGVEISAEGSAPRPTVHCIGWKKADAAVYLFVGEDGSTILTDKLQAV